MTTNQQLDKLCMEHFGNRKYVAEGISVIKIGKLLGLDYTDTLSDFTL